MDQKIVSTNPADDYNIIGEVSVTPKSGMPKMIKETRTASKEWQKIDIYGSLRRSFRS